jgi:hypothetical protein
MAIVNDLRSPRGLQGDRFTIDEEVVYTVEVPGPARKSNFIRLPNNSKAIARLKRKNEEYAGRVITALPIELDARLPIQRIADGYKFGLSNELLKRGEVRIGEAYLFFLHRDGSVHPDAFNHAVGVIKGYCKLG